MLLDCSAGGFSMRKQTLIATAVTSLLSVSVAFAEDTATTTSEEMCDPDQPCATPPPAPAPAPAPAPHSTYVPMQTEQPVVVYEKPGMYSYAWRDPTLESGIGVSFQVGGGVGGFTDSSVNNLSSSEIGGVWQFRSTIGSHTPLGVDLAYNGTAYDVQDFSGVASDTLIGTEFEGALRWNMLPHYAWNPYIFGGVGWQHYDLNDNVLTRADSGIGSSDDIAVFPMGVGLAFRDDSGFTGELRGTFRAAASSSFIQDATGADADLHTWEATAGIGYEL
jgi:hypothetical protein